MKIKIVLAMLLLAVIILASMLLARIQTDAASMLPYTIGSTVIPATQMPAGMAMKEFDVPSDEPVPTIALDLSQDTMSGWNVHVTTTNFAFTPEHLNAATMAGEGHVHLYIDDKLIIMLSPWYHIDALTPGTHTIRVALFNNDHSAYMINGMPIDAQTVVDSSSTAMAGM